MSARTATIGRLREWMEEWYPPPLAETWDRVGLVVGNPRASVKKVLLAVDPVRDTVDEAIQLGANLLLTHHPLYLRGVSFLPETDPKGSLVTRLIRANCGLYNAHTNADRATPGVAEALAKHLGLTQIRPLHPDADDPARGELRLGQIAPTRLADFAKTVASRLPQGPTGLLVGGNLDHLVETVAVCGGAGDSFLDECRRAGADVYITADLRHHPALECLEHQQMALICGSHWATEWLWLPVLAEQLRERARLEEVELEVVVSRHVTEPWSLHLETTGGTAEIPMETLEKPQG